VEQARNGQRGDRIEIVTRHPHWRRKTLTAFKPARLARWACLGALVTTLIGCSNNVTAWRKDDPGGLYPAGEMSGEPTFGVGWRRRL
jgi:hypothetical protein